MASERLNYLFYRWLDQAATVDEVKELSELLASAPSADVEALMQEGWESFSHERPIYSAQESAALFQTISQRIAAPVDMQYKAGSGRERFIVKSLRWTVAAATVIAVIGGAYFFREKNSGPKSQIAVVRHDASPGGNKAVLTLANGSKINLDSAPNGELALDGDARIFKNKDGRLEYKEQPANRGNDLPVLYNTMSTPRGGQYQLFLPDGTKVWLNAASSITYPTTFKKVDPKKISDGLNYERLVTVNGEAYFEVAPDPLSPFKVKVNDMTVEVLGTNFNINAYSDQPFISTSLLKGRVQVFKGNAVAALKPGQQARVEQSGHRNTGERLEKIIDVSDNIDEDKVLAWKNGMFNFNNADINAVMSEVSRWYDLDVSYEGSRPDQHYTGKIPRKLYASQMLKILEESGVHFRIEGKKLIINQ